VSLFLWHFFTYCRCVVQAEPEALYMKMNEVQTDILKSNNIVSICSISYTFLKIILSYVVQGFGFFRSEVGFDPPCFALAQSVNNEGQVCSCCGEFVLSLLLAQRRLITEMSNYSRAMDVFTNILRKTTYIDVKYILQFIECKIFYI